LEILTVYSHYILLSLLHVKANIDTFCTRGELHSLDLRHGHSLNIPYCRLNKKKECFPILALKMYNMLPAGVKSLEENSFRTKMKSWLIGRAYYSLKEFFDDNFSDLA